MPYADKTWREVQSALRMSGVGEVDLEKLHGVLRGLTDKQQEASVHRGLFSGIQSNDGSAVSRRNYFRAWHFLNAVITLDRLKQQPSADADATQRSRYQSSSSNELAIRDELKAMVGQILGKDETPIEMPSAPVTRLMPVVRVDTSVITQRLVVNVWQKQVEATRKRNIAVKSAADRFSALRHGNLVKEVAHFKMDNLRADWDLERAKINKVFVDHLATLPSAQAAMGEALQAAYTQFNEVLRDVQKAKQARLDMAASAFEVLEKLPSPFDLVGKVGKAIAKSLKVSTVEDMTREVVRPPDLRAPEFSKKIMAKVAALAEKKDEFMTVGVNLGDLEKPAKLSALLFDIVKQYMLHVQEEVNAAIDEKFGKSGVDVDAKLKVYVDETAVTAVTAQPAIHALKIGHVDRRDNLLANSVAQQQVLAAVKGELVGFSSGVREELAKRLLKFDFGALKSEDMRCLIELYLIGGYVMAEFKRAKGKYGDMKLEDPLILRLQRSDEWGFLSATGEHHASTPTGRLVWKGKENHYRALVYFVRYFRSRFHPFDLLRGVQTLPEGDLVTAAKIKEDLHTYADRLAAAIHSTREKGFFGSTWKWDQVDVVMAR